MHRLTPLLEPQSIAVVGASARAGRPGYHTVRAVRRLGFDGPVYPVTPSYEQIEGLTCYASLAELPSPVDLVVVAGASARLESQVEQAVDVGAGAVLAYANINELTATDPGVGDRMRDRVREAGVALAGPYSIGYVNVVKNRAASWLEPDPDAIRRGGIVTIVQSGGTFSYTLISEPRAGFVLNVHPGQEIDIGVADYMDYALSLPQTRVIGLFLETVRDPDGFRAALARADDQRVPVVVLHVGRSEPGAHHVRSHAGRLAGSVAGLDAVFRHHGVFRVDTMEEWWASLLLFDTERRPGAGGVVAMADSGGQRALIADHAAVHDVPWATISSTTSAKLAETLDPTLNAENPLDFWGGEPDWPARCELQLRALLDDPGAAIGVVFTDFTVTDMDPLPLTLAKVCREVGRDARIPLVAAQYTARHFHPEAIHLMTDAGIPVLDGSRETMRALKNVLYFRDRDERKPRPPSPLPVEAPVGAPPILDASKVVDESSALDWLSSLGIAVARQGVARSRDEAFALAQQIGFPVVLKTAATGVAHKSDVQGVYLDLRNLGELESAYAALAQSLGPDVTVAQMVAPGVEVALGMVRDPQFGALVMLGSGGVMVEVANDATFALPPFDPGTARALLRSLALSPRLDGIRGQPPVDIESLARLISRFSIIAAAVDESVLEIDVNPVLVSPAGSVAVDALLIRKDDKGEQS